ncbi:MAG: nickel pincer cofactor biosynthesis protein LarC [Candidatus Alcyoniella australis]|nr:nickel pincer cofactor biosynthesis protein LarC [Candidatus Alcyoniella australis]
MRIAYIDPLAGLAGDMLLSALVHAGLDPKLVRELPQRLGLDGVKVSVGRTHRGAISARTIKVRLASQRKHRNLEQLNAIIRSADLPRPVERKALAVFNNLARAEAAVHGEKLSRVHFHEVGMDDALIDVVGVCLGLHELGVRRIWCGSLPLGSGSVNCQHGELPMPAPAAAKLLCGLPVIMREDLPGERVTPTGAALAQTLVDSFERLPRMRLESVGYGAGSRDEGGLPNVVRVMIGEALDEQFPQAAVAIETNLDDMNPQLCQTLTQRLLEAGAYDVIYAPVTMKKGRPGLWVQVICPEAVADQARELLLRETTALGVRSYAVERNVLARSSVEVHTAYGTLRVKLGITRSGEVLNAHPEFDDCCRAADEHSVPVKEVIQAALTAYRLSNSR